MLMVIRSGMSPHINLAMMDMSIISALLDVAVNVLMVTMDPTANSQRNAILDSMVDLVLTVVNPLEHTVTVNASVLRDSMVTAARFLTLAHTQMS